MLFRIRHKKRCLKLQLLDYLENTIQSKLENQYLHPELQKAYQNAYFDITSSLEGQDRLDHMVQLEKMNQKERKEKPKSTFSKEMQGIDRFSGAGRKTRKRHSADRAGKHCYCRNERKNATDRRNYQRISLGGHYHHGKISYYFGYSQTTIG